MKDDFAATLAAHLVAEEGRRAKMYLCPAGFNTVGVGHNMDAKPISERAIEAILADDIADVEADLDGAMPWWRTLSIARRVALASMCFQLGLAGLLGFRRMLAALQDGRWEEAADEALQSRWARQTPNRARRVTEMIRLG